MTTLHFLYISIIIFFFSINYLIFFFFARLIIPGLLILIFLALFLVYFTSDKFKLTDNLIKWLNSKIYKSKDHDIYPGYSYTYKPSKICKSCDNNFNIGDVKGCIRCGDVWHSNCDIHTPCNPTITHKIGSVPRKIRDKINPFGPR